MPTTASGLTFYEETFETAVWEGLTQNIDGFNAKSGNAIVLEAGARKGRKPVRTVASTISGLIQRRDPSGTGTLTPTVFGNYEHRTIKIFRSAPLILRRQDWVDMGMTTEEGQYLYGVQFGQGQVLDYLNTAISSLVGSLNAIGATALLDVTGESPGTLSHATLSRALNKLGDRRQSVASLVAHSTPMGDLIGTAFSSQTIAFQLAGGGGTIYNGMIPALGLATLVTDSSSLLVGATSASGSVDNYNTLALVPGAVRVKTGAMGQGFSLVPGTATAVQENLTWLLQIEWEFEIEIKGIAYKSGSADNPTAAALATSSNWQLVASDRKLGPGALLLSK